MTKATIGRMAIKAGIVGFMIIPLAGCDENGKISFLKPKAEAAVSDGNTTAESGPSSQVKTVEQDVESPDVFHVTEKGLWDGRPSLGGVWVAHPTVKDPERVIIRNPQNGKSVIGALFRREIANPGPKLQVSSDAAAALGILAGQPTKLDVVALRRKEVPIAQPAAAESAMATDIAPKQIDEKTLDDPIASAAAAIDDVQGKTETDGTDAKKPATRPAAAAAATAAQAATKLPVSTLTKPYIQIGIFSIEANANKTAAALRKAGAIPTVRKQTSKGKTFWRVLVGPATTKAERTALLKKVKGIGYSDAYAVTN